MKNTIEETVAAPVTALAFNLEALDLIIKDLRNARRSVLAIETGREETKVTVDAAKIALQGAIDTADLEAMTKQTDILKRGMRKLAEKPEAKIQAFNDAQDRLAHFTSFNADIVVEEPETAETPADTTLELAA